MISKLVMANKHQIEGISGGQIQVDDQGLIKTALGMVTAQSIKDAREILTKIKLGLSKTTSPNLDLLTSYLQLIPQKVPRKRGWGGAHFSLNFRQWTLIEKLDMVLKKLDIDSSLVSERSFLYPKRERHLRDCSKNESSSLDFSNRKS